VDEFPEYDRPRREGVRHGREHRPPRAPRSRTHARHEQTVLDALRELPNFVRLLYGLLTDERVDVVDKLLVAGAVGYVLLPVDILPDWIPLIGEVDDVFVLVLAVRRLLAGAGRRVVMEHWAGDPEELDDLNLKGVLGAAAFFLPRRIRRRLRTIGRV